MEERVKTRLVTRKFRVTAADGKLYNTNHYNLDAIISVGYRVKSVQGTRFCIWAAKRLKDHILKGYTLNQQLLSQKIEHYEELQSQLATLRRVYNAGVCPKILIIVKQKR